jgi:hypothetical protein
MSAIRYLYNRNQEYMTTPEEKQKEDKIIKHILQTNKYNTLSKIKQKKQKNQEDTHKNGQNLHIPAEKLASSTNSSDKPTYGSLTRPTTTSQNY